MSAKNSSKNKTPSPTEGVKREVYFNEFNVLLENTAYLPLVSGLLRAYAETSSEIKANYEFKPFIFHRDTMRPIIAQYNNPSVAAFSVSLWNEQLNLKVAEQVKSLFPDCLVVFGGPSVPHFPDDYFQRYPFIDITVRAEGEEAFSEILSRNLESRDFSNIFGIAWRDPKTGSCIRNEGERPQPRDLDIYPSPYLEGLFDGIFDDHPNLEFQQIIETNRGCPFLCTFCFWGQGGLSRKYRFHSIERVKLDIEWAAKHKIRYLFNADSNFGMHKRDAEIAEILVQTKTNFGFPDKFRTAYGKNTDDKIFQVAKLLHEHGLGKSVTLARQSMDETVLVNIKRDNIKMSTYANLQTRFNEDDIPVYCELILGLPGETYETWAAGMDELLSSGLKNQIFIYMCQIYPNTDLADPEYQKKFGVVTHRIPLTEMHGAIRPAELVTEYEEIIVATDSMPLAEWRRTTIFSWVTVLLHSMKLGFFALYYLQDRHGIKNSELITYISDRKMKSGTGETLRAEVGEFESQLDRLLDGHGQGRELPEFGQIYWHEEEASFLRISNDLDNFYGEFLDLLREFLDLKGVSYDDAELQELVRYQRMRIRSHHAPADTEHRFNFNFPEYFETCFRAEAQLLTVEPQILTVSNPRDYQGDKADYARETILWGRNSGTMLTDVSWRGVKETVASNR